MKIPATAASIEKPRFFDGLKSAAANQLVRGGAFR